MKKCSLVLAFILIAISVCLPVQALGLMDFVIDSNGQQISIPQTHRVTKLIRDPGIADSVFSNPSDLYVDEKDNIYIADTGNNRILKFNKDGKYIAEFTCNGKFSSPQSVFVTENGDIYVSDTLNERIVHLSDKGEYIEEFVKPETELLGEDVSFQIGRLGLTSQGYLYTIHGQNFMMIDANNEFKGFVGDNKLGFSLKRLLIRMFASKEQQSKLVKETANSYTSFDISADGLIYAVTAQGSSNQIQKINMVGTNIFPKKVYGEKFYNPETKKYMDPQFSDICVNNDDIIYAIEGNSARIYAYDQEGNLLAIFGGSGTTKGRFNLPVAVDCMSNGDLLVLDQATGCVHWYEQTDFMKNISQAVKFYNEGKYDDACKTWEDVLSLNANYPVANKGIGDALYKQGKIEESMGYYELADNKSGYGNAFSKYQYSFFREYFLWVVLSIVFIIAVVLFVVFRLKKRADRTVELYYSGGKNK